ncbi:MAG: BamA/TamA family outer membrane protein [Bacteroidales bacterium]
MTSIRTTISVFFLVIFVMIMQSCAPTKYVGEDQYLLNRYRIEDEKSDIPKEEFRNFVKQKPNKRFLGWKFWLSIYNLSGKDSTSGLNRWLKEIGEPPVIYSEDMKENTVQQLEMFLFNKGYFDAHIGDTTLIKKKKANVIYRIEPGKPHYIGNIDYFFEDALLSQYIMGDSASFILKTDQKYDVDNFRAENMRIEEILRNTGYYNFTRDYIYYQVDSTTSSRQVNVTMGIRNYPERDRLGNMIRTQHPTYKVGRVYMKTGSDVIGLSGSSESSRLDTTRNGDVIVISDPDVRIRHELVAQKNYIIPGDLYNQRKVQQTYRNLTALSVFRLVDINFTVVEGQKNLLDCEIQMLPSVKQAFTGGIESTTSGGNIGAAGNLNYQHRNLFGGSERFDLTFLGAIETLPENPDKPPEELGTMQELGMEASLKLPQFLLPFRTDQFIRKFNPETNFNLTYNYQKRPDYTRTTFRGSFGYQWRGNRFVTHSVYPVEISLINTPALDAEFREWLEGTYLYYSYLPHFITNQRYRLVYTNQRINKTTDFQYVRFGFETAGNLMYGLYQLVGKPLNDAVFQLFGVDYAQYVRTGIDFRHYDYKGESSSLVYRGFLGMAVPYLNSSAIPFEKQYFGGGANSIRAWRVKNLGPGSFEGDTISKYPNQTADLKIEVNIEYRFGLFWKLEGAMFVDAGNIWSLSAEDDRQGALFDVKRFYREIAVGTGFGLRFDFNFFIFRFDLGIPLVDPSYPQNNRWVYSQTDMKWNDLGYNFAIGYPF